MELNYIILAYNKPLQLKRLVEKLQHPKAKFYIHIDKDSAISQFKNSLEHLEITFLPDQKRFSGTWGDIGIVKASIEAIKLAFSENKKAYYILLSGQDYPIKPVSQIFQYLEENYGTDYLTLYKLPHQNWETGGIDRLTRYKVNKTGKRKHFLQLPSIFEREFYMVETLGKLNFLRKSKRYKEMKLVFRKRGFPKNLKPYGGSQWWCLTSEIINTILQFINQNPDYLLYHQYTLLPDEIFFHSIVGSLRETNNLKLARSLTYVNWERPSGPLPVTFKKEDFEELKEASKSHLFARKFDMEQDAEILDEIDKRLLD